MAAPLEAVSTALKDVKLLADALGNLFTTIADGWNDTSFDRALTAKRTEVATITSSGVAYNGPCLLSRVFVVGTGSGTFRVRDGGASGTIKIGTASTAVATTASPSLPFEDCFFGTDLYVEIVSGTPELNVFYIPQA